MALENRRSIVAREPGAFEIIEVVDGSMVFNKSPGPNVFTVTHMPDKPVSERLRELTTEFSRRKVDAGPHLSPGGKPDQSKN